MRKIHHLQILVLCFCFGICKAQNTKIDSLRLAFTEAKQDSLKIKLNLELAIHYLYFEPDSTIAIGQRNLELIETSGTELDKALTMIRLGDGYGAKLDFEPAIAYYQNSLSFFTSINDKRYIGECYNRLANVSIVQRNFYQAILRYKIALENFRDIDDTVGEIIVLANIGNIYIEVEDYDKALRFYNQAANMSTQQNMGFQIGYSLNIAEIYIKTGKFNRVFEIINPAVEKCIATNSKISLAHCYNHLATAHLSFNETNKTISYAKKALRIMNAANSDVLDAQLNKLLSFAYEKSDINKALNHAIKSYEVAVKHNYIRELSESSIRLFELYSKKGNLKEANKFAKIHIGFAKKLNEEKEDKSLIREQIDFEIKEVEYKKGLELAQLKNVNQEKEYNLKLAQKRNTILWIGLLVVAMVFYMFIVTLQKRKIKEVLEDNLILENKVQEIEKSIANDLHDNFGNRLAGVLSSYSIVKELNENTKNKDPNFKKFSKNIEDNLMFLNGDIKDLLWAMNPDNNEYMTIIRRLKLIFQNFESHSEIKIELKHSKTKDRFMLPKLANRQLVLMLKEVVNNAVKYSKSDCIDISILIDDDNHLKISCIDYGVGFDFDELNRINGINHLIERARLIKFSFDIDSEIGKGTKISLKSIYPLKRIVYKTAS